MAEQALDRMQVHASFQQVGRKRVPQRMNATGLRDAGATLRRLIRPLQAGRIQRLRPPWGGKQPGRRVRDSPVRAQLLEQVG